MRSRPGRSGQREHPSWIGRTRAVSANRPIARKSLHVDATTADGAAVEMLKALGSDTRMGILRLIDTRAKLGV